jgi:Holliday junction resolvasome RuvABC endonuclease subunit
MRKVQRRKANTKTSKLGLGRSKAPKRKNVSIKSIANTNFTKVLSIDPSSHSLGWAVIEIGLKQPRLIKCGKIKFPKSPEMHIKFQAINDGLAEICKEYKPNHCVIEQSVYIQNFQTSRVISYIIGYSWGIAQGYCSKVIDINPMIWKRGVGYKNLSKDDKEYLLTEASRKKERKDRVRDIITGYFEMLDDDLKDDDIVDAIGIGLWYYLMLRKDGTRTVQR